MKMTKQSLPQRRIRMRRSRSKDRIVNIQLLSDGQPIQSINPGAQSKPSPGPIVGENSIPSIPHMQKRSRPIVSDENQQHAAIARGALMQLERDGLVYRVLAKKKNEVRICLNLDIWTPELKLRTGRCW